MKGVKPGLSCALMSSVVTRCGWLWPSAPGLTRNTSTCDTFWLATKASVPSRLNHTWAGPLIVGRNWRMAVEPGLSAPFN